MGAEKRVHLDANVVAGLAFDRGDEARDFVSSERARGSRILLSPSVIEELAGATRFKRQKYLDAAQRFCHGYTNMKYQNVLKHELECFNAGRSMSDIPTLPISKLSWLVDDGTARAAVGDYQRGSRIKEIAIRCLNGIKDEILDEEVDGGFKDFYPVFAHTYYRAIMTVLVNDGAKAPDVGPGGVPARVDNRAIVAFMDMLAANVFRRKTVKECKGAVAISDMCVVVEIAYSDGLLTRDNELYECGVLRESAWPGSTPLIMKVPTSS